MSVGVRAGPSFYAGDDTSPVAVCTLSSFDLLDDLARSPIAERLAIIGPLETENIGLERMLMTLLERPRIRWLILCGDEHRGRRPAQALRCLMEQGVAADGTIPGARSRLARLRTLGPEHVDAVRRQVRIRDLVGSHDLTRIAQAAQECLADDPGPFPEPVTLPKPEPIVVPQQTLTVREQDPSGFLVILVDREARQLLVEHYAPDGALLHRFAGPDAESLCVALVEWQIVTRLEHAAYLGRELATAEFALQYGLSYRQDAPLARRSGWERPADHNADR
jgi:tetrahydromethanopterin S-methyltransferase subunit A